jgi:dienelactone hydrolase
MISLLAMKSISEAQCKSRQPKGYQMNKSGILLLISLLFSFRTLAQTPQGPRAVNLKAPDSTLLKATYFSAGKLGPGVLLFHQSNRTRESWEGVAQQLAAAGMNVLTVDSRGHGESSGKYDNRKAGEDVDAAFNYLVSQPGVNHDVIGAGGAGWLGVIGSVEAARRHAKEIKSLVLMSGETLRDGLQFLHQASQLPELFVFSDEDEYPPTQDAMKLLYVTASSPSKKLVHYSAAEDAPWLWYETSDVGRVPAHGGHGTDLFKVHPELPGIIVQWFVTTLIKTPGHARADSLAAASLLNQLQTPGGAVQVKQELVEARKKDPQTQFWPEVAVDIIGEDYQRAGDIKNAIEIFQLNLLAYPDSADANSNLADAYLADGQKDLARQYAEKALALLNSHKTPLSSWSDTEPRRDEIRDSAQRTLERAMKGPDH